MLHGVRQVEMIACQDGGQVTLFLEDMMILNVYNTIFTHRSLTGMNDIEGLLYQLSPSPFSFFQSLTILDKIFNTKQNENLNEL